MNKKILLISIIILFLSSFFLFSSSKIYKFLKKKNEQIMYAYNSIELLKLEINKNQVEAGYIKNIFDEKILFKKINLRKLLDYDSESYERPFGYIDFFEEKILFVSGKGEIFISNNFNNDFDKIKFQKLNSNLKNKFYLNDEIESQTYRRNFVRDILIDKNNLYIVVLDMKNINNVIKYSTKIIKAEINNYNYLDFNDFLKFDEINYVSDDEDFDPTHGGGRLVKYKKNQLLFSVPDFGQELKAQNKKYIFGKILTINKDTKQFDIFSLGHRNPQGLNWDEENDIIISSEHGPKGGDEVNLIQKEKNYGWPIVSKGYGGSSHIKSNNHDDFNFEEPIYFWSDLNCGPSEIIRLSDNFLNQKKNSYILSCLSGASPLTGRSLYNFTFQDGNFKKIQRIVINDRIRDLKLYDDNNLILVLEESHSLGILYTN